MSSPLFLHVRERLLQERDDVVVVQRVIDQAASPPRPDEAHAPQQPQLMRDGGFAAALANPRFGEAMVGGTCPWWMCNSAIVGGAVIR